jgi:DNA repair exonuclease SbcCD ATPase subunit
VKIRSIELTNFRKFVGTIKVENIGDKVSVLVGRNELGKSTLLEAINAAIFEKAKSTAAHVKAYRHFVNGTIPEVKLSFDVGGKSWTIHKKFAGQGGKSILKCSDNRLFEDDAAEDELQKLLGFKSGSRGGEPGIWGTLWVRQGESFGQEGLNEQAQQTLQQCIEAQVGLVTGGSRGQKIPKAVKAALNELQSGRGPRGKYKEAIDQLQVLVREKSELEDKRALLAKELELLERSNLDLKTEKTDWDEAAHLNELSAQRANKTLAATLAAEIAAAAIAAKSAHERGANATKALQERQQNIGSFQKFKQQVADLEPQTLEVNMGQKTAKDLLEAGEIALAALRDKASKMSNRNRNLERTRTLVSINKEIVAINAVLESVARLESQADRLSEAVGAIAATDLLIAQIEKAGIALVTAEAAMNAVATAVSFDIQTEALSCLHLNGTPLNNPKQSISLIEKTNIAIREIGTITIEPKVKDRVELLKRMQNAEAALENALTNAGAKDLATAREAAAQRNQHTRRLEQIQKEIAGLAIGDPTKNLKPGLEYLKLYVGGLRGQLRNTLAELGLEKVPTEEALVQQIEQYHKETERLDLEISKAGGSVAGLKVASADADKNAQDHHVRFAIIASALASKEADLNASRNTVSDDQLEADVRRLEIEVASKQRDFEEKEKVQTEPAEAIDAKIRRLEGAEKNHRDAIKRLETSIARSSALVEAQEGAGIEEMLLAQDAEIERLGNTVAEFEKEAAVLGLLSETLEQAESEAKTRYLAPIVNRVQPYLKMLLPDTDIILDETLQISALTRAGQNEDFSLLSGGTREQLAILTRLAFAELLLGQGRPATVILDDALAFSDDERIESMFDVLMRAGEQVQIIVLTCRKKLFSRLGAAQIIIDGAA